MGLNWSTSSVIDPSPNTKQIIDTTTHENKESTTLIWFDPNIGSQEDTKETKERLRRINDYVKFYTDVNQCITSIQSGNREKIFLITSGSKASDILPSVVSLRQVDCIFIFCWKKERYEHLINRYSKIIGIYIHVDELCKSIQEQIDLVDKQLQTFSFFDRSQKSTKDLSKESAEFLWFQLFNYIINRLPRDKQAKQQMVEICKQYYRGNSKELSLIDQFDREYQSKEAIHWYSKQSFVYRLINKALRTEDIDLLYIFRFFIGDLTEALRHEHEKILSSEKEILIVYRGAKLDKEEFDKLKENQHNLISTNGYLSASRLRERALCFAMKQSKRTNVISVLFQIECNVKQLDKCVIFGDIAQYSKYPKEEEVLFDLSACFRIDSIEHFIEQHESVQLIKMSASNEGQTITKDYIKLTQQETEEQSVSIVFGRLMCNLGEYDKSQKYFEQLLKDPNGEDVAWIEFNIGRALYYKCEWKDAKEYYDRAYQRMKNAEPARTNKDLAYVLNNIGVILDNQGKYDEAFDHYQQVLEMRQKYYPSDHVDIAKSLNNIGSILYKQRRCEEALHYHQRALKMKEKCYPPGHVSIAASLNNIGIILSDQENYNEALKYHERAIEMQKKYYPSGHVDIAKSLICIGRILDKQGKLDGALNYYRQALEMQEKICPSGHLDIANSFKNIGHILLQQGKDNEALNYYRRSLEMREKYCSFDHVDIAADLNKIGNILYQQRTYDEALNHYRQALTMQQKCYPPGHSDIAINLYNIGLILHQQENYDEAVKYYLQALEMQENYYRSGHVDIGKTLNNIGVCYEYQNMAKIALDYYRRALKVYENFLPNEHQDRVGTENSIRRLNEMK